MIFTPVYGGGTSGSSGALDFSFDGTMSAVARDDAGNWEFSLLSSGKSFVFKKDPGLIDVCLVGAGGYGGGLGGAGGGYVVTLRGVVVTKGEVYEIVIGEGAVSGDERGGKTTAFGGTAEGGKSSSDRNGADGGNGGGGGAPYGKYNDKNDGGDGGDDGNDGEGGSSYYYEYPEGITNSDYTLGGKGQKSIGMGTTRAFGEETGKQLAGGGAGDGELSDGIPGTGGGFVGQDAQENTGGGGGASGGKGACGIVIVRNHREVAA